MGSTSDTFHVTSCVSLLLANVVSLVVAIDSCSYSLVSAVLSLARPNQHSGLLSLIRLFGHVFASQCFGSKTTNYN